MLARRRHEDVHFEKKLFLTNSGRKEFSESKRSTCKNRACKIFAPKRQQKIACGVIALLAMTSLKKRRVKENCSEGLSMPDSFLLGLKERKSIDENENLTR